MKNKHIALLGILILSLILVSGSFFAGFAAIQNLFAVPREIEGYISGVKGGNSLNTMPGQTGTAGGSAGTGTNLLTKGALVRLDLYVIMDESRDIQSSVIGKLDAAEGTAKLITVPEDTKISLSDGLYRTLSAEFPAIPQLFKLGVLSDYVEPEKLGAVLADIFLELFSCKFSGVWLLEQGRADGWLDVSQNPVSLTDAAENYLELSPVGKQALYRLKEFETMLSGGESIPAENSSIPLERYAETIAVMKAENITAELICGSREAEGYVLDTVRAARQLSGAGE